MNEIIKAINLKSINVGCTIGNYKFQSNSHVDNIVLVVESEDDLQKMVI